MEGIGVFRVKWVEVRNNDRAQLKQGPNEAS